MTTEGASSLSDRLRRAREERGETVEQVNQLIGISPRLLRGLESGDLDVVEPVYVLLAVKSYGEHLGLDVDELLHMLEQELPVPTKPSPIVIATEAGAGASLMTGVSAHTADAMEMLRRLPQSQRLALVGVAVVIAVFLVLWLAGALPDNPAQSNQHRQAAAVAHVETNDSDVSRIEHKAPTSVVTAPATASAVVMADDGPPEQVAEAVPLETEDSLPTYAPVAPQIEDVAAATEEPPAGAAAPDGIPPIAPTNSPEASSPKLVTQASAGAAADTSVANDSVANNSVADLGGDLDLAAAKSTVVASTDMAISTVTAAPAHSVAIANPIAPIAPIANSLGPAEDVDTARQLTLEAEAVDSTWVQVEWDGGAGGIEEVIPRGEKHRWQAREFFMVKAGRAHGVRFYLEGKLLGDGRLGDPTEVLRFRASKDSVTLLSRDLQPLSQLIVEHDFAPSD